MIHLILGRAGAGKTARIFGEIAGLVRECRENIILLVPEQYSHEAERELCRAAGDALSLYGEVLSFTGLARRALARCGAGRTFMDAAGRFLCMTAAAEAAEGSLRVYARSAGSARHLDSLLSAVLELKNAGIDADTLIRTAAEVPETLGGKLRDLSVLMEAYAAAEGQSRADPADILALLASLIGSTPEGRGTYYIDGFTDFTVLEKNVLEALMRAGADITLCLTLDPDDGEEGVFGPAAATRRWITRAAERCGASLAEERMGREEPASVLTCYCDHLFDFAPVEVPPDDGTLRLVSAADICEECELAAARMAELARSGVRFREMAVAVRGFADYRAALESACARYEIPLFLSGRGDILRRSIPALISSALEAVTRGFGYEAVFGYLKTGLAPLPPEECTRLENYVYLWNVRGALWERPFTMHPEGYNRPFDEETETRLSELNGQRERVIVPLLSLRDAMSRAGTAAEQAAALAGFFTDIRLPDTLQRRAAQLRETGRAETAAEYVRLWDIVCTALGQFAAVLGDMPMDADRFSDLFCRMLSKYDVNVIPVSLDRVQAGDLDGMRRRHIRHLFLLGAADGRLPAPEAEGILFTPDERETLTAIGLPMGGTDEALDRELSLIYSCLTLPSETLTVSMPLTDPEGGKTRPSVVIERARSLFGLPVVPGDIVRARTFSPEAAFSLAVQGAVGSEEPLCLAARDWAAASGRAGALRSLTEAAAAGRGRLSPAAVRALYGDRPGLSASRAERFAQCRFAYFMQYGIRARPRRKAVFDPRDHGTFMHDILENVARSVMEEGGFPLVSRERVRELTDLFIDRYIRDELKDFAGRNDRFRYLFLRLRSTVQHVTEDMWEELRHSDFVPLDLELDLAAEGVLDPADGGELRVTGRADRVDGWVHDGVLYLRITDYKTGSKQFSLSEVCEGMDLQMLMYLFTLQDRGKTRFGADEIRPAGVLYSPARFEPVAAERDPSDEELASLRGSSSRRSGLLLLDDEVIEAMEHGGSHRFLPVKRKSGGGWDRSSLRSLATAEQFGALSRYVYTLLGTMASELREGSVTADPWYRNRQENACQWCDYAKACLFDEGRDAWRIRKDLTTEEAWERIGSHE